MRGGVGELVGPGDVAAGVDVRVDRLQELVGLHGARLGERDAELLQPVALGVRRRGRRAHSSASNSIALLLALVLADEHLRRLQEFLAPCARCARRCPRRGSAAPPSRRPPGPRAAACAGASRPGSPSSRSGRTPARARSRSARRPAPASRGGSARRSQTRFGSQAADLRRCRESAARSGSAPAAITIERVRERPCHRLRTVQGEVIFASPRMHFDAEAGIALDRIVRLDRPDHALHALHHLGEVEFGDPLCECRTPSTRRIATGARAVRISAFEGHAAGVQAIAAHAVLLDQRHLARTAAAMYAATRPAEPAPMTTRLRSNRRGLRQRA